MWFYHFQIKVRYLKFYFLFQELWDPPRLEFRPKIWLKLLSCQIIQRQVFVKLYTTPIELKLQPSFFLTLLLLLFLSHHHASPISLSQPRNASSTTAIPPSSLSSPSRDGFSLLSLRVLVERFRSVQSRVEVIFRCS